MPNTMKFRVAALLLFAGAGAGAGSARAAGAQLPGVRVNPTVARASARGVTTTVLVYSNLVGATPAEALWCGRVIGELDRGVRCDPATIYGQAPPAPASATATGTFTDVMSVPAPVSQRAYEAARAGGSARFYYVRRFVMRGDVRADAEQFVAVTLLLGGDGAGAPFTLTYVRLATASGAPVVFVQRGDRPPALSAEIAYTGTGRLRGRWEVVRPGDPLPGVEDLRTEGSLPPERRGLQRRFEEVQRFNVLLLPNGRAVLPGPDPERLPTSVDGAYMILLRIEATEDPARAGGAGGAGGAAGTPGLAGPFSGAAAGFPMPTLRYVVGAARSRALPAARIVRLRLPAPNAVVVPDSALTLAWADERGASRYRVEVERAGDGARLLSAIVNTGAEHYTLPPFVTAQLPAAGLRWRVVALDAAGGDVARSEWRTAKARARP